MDQLEQARVEINAIDKEMAALFERRMQAVNDVAAYKLAHQLPILDVSREQAVIRKNLEYLQDESLKPYFQQVLEMMMQVSRDFQKHKIGQRCVVYPGVEGAFSHIAAKQLFPEASLHQVYTFEEAFQAVECGEAEFGVVPFENSYTGEVGEVLDHLLYYDLHIQDVYDLKIQQNLLVLPGTDLADIKQVYSHPQAISQSRKFLDCYHWEVIPYTNTATAAKYVSETKDPSKAAIASGETAALYGLEILKEHINTSDQNTTRFIVISKQMRSFGNRFHILFTLRHDAGQLAKVMQLIAEYGFNMESIKSRPLHDQPWQYYFYVELDGNIADPHTADLLRALEKQCEKVKLLGAFNARKG
ncbi:bifunctional chorismate mutase/prephenate dehydratase [Clostridiaceae bacterium DONG20-135]|uniref:Bifunctional chorismate mutase/prephenate dehydratase n=1 Tax=Copranaerobaculum intestinale TaxID=2692629 RepID=A0A6N8U3C1_9FIRM|nr:bifunctional chorismate mutase/prephenate dehydratase [Copranaerobaculum intestinale]MXQ72682.1 bifunctional chorismate mutase/prephenate dehydratase [Copranaerobaculum intestinale]